MRKPHGLAALSPLQRNRIARKGGIASQASGKAHRYTREEAITYGRIGGTKLARDRDYMREIGRKGGLSNDRERLREIGRLGGLATQAKRRASRLGGST